MESREGVPLTVYHSHPGGAVALSWDDRRSMKEQYAKDIPIPWLVVTEEKSRLWYMEDNWYYSIPIRNGLVHV
jgi:proteasome lid subunit RPN8/RPN11